MSVIVYKSKRNNRTATLPHSLAQGEPRDSGLAEGTSFMQTRSSCQPTHLNGYNPLRRPSYPLTHLKHSPLRPVSPPSPLARYHAVDVTLGPRRSVCDLIIPEEAHGLSSDLPATLHNHIDLSLEFLKRHHKPKSVITRAPSDPQILSTNTTQPVHISKSPYVSPPPIFILPYLLPAQWLLSLHAQIPSMPAFVVPVTSTSRPPPLASRQRPCATKSPVSYPP